MKYGKKNNKETETTDALQKAAELESRQSALRAAAMKQLSQLSRGE